VAPPRAVTPPGKPNWPLIILGALVVIAVGFGIWYAHDSGTTVTEVTETGKKTTTTKAVPSDTLLSAALGVGAALMLAGALWSRIKSITLPGGAVVSLDSDEVGQAKDTVAKKAVEKNMAEPPQVATATTRTLAEIRRRKAEKGALDPSDYDSAAESVFQVMQRTAT
jgi:hypothetical protein